ncbi:hypothetical protein B0J15DRAFT_564513 [Fusarium solani]|uniref:Uncharacterized protein n=1 Tax=Fusarium solani TaxID=169388 RepID=A0A9P9K1M0_FUSSL|nr:uncharacterized protein B0J15DRAFT_564513 [Fusarium solani]KAH7244753.1 hypothetical protein B0J15DRAFT_564513 [Fusarium solani]
MRPYEDHIRQLDEASRASRVFSWVMGDEKFVEHRANNSCLSTEDDDMIAFGSHGAPSTTSNTEFWMEHNDEYQFSISEDLVEQTASHDSSDEPQKEHIAPEAESISPHSSLVMEFFADFGPVFEHEALMTRVFYPAEIEDEDSTSESHESWNGLHRDEVFLIDLYDTSCW